MNVKEKVVMITTQFEGVHKWKDCPYEDVAFLRYYHRHRFVVRVGVRVEGSNREVEFFMLKRLVEKEILARWDGKWFEDSCEMIAESIGCELAKMGYNIKFVEVWEDGENGARLEW